MNISKNSVVSITYTLHEANAEGDIVEKVEKEQPFTFLFGAGELLPLFEQNLDGLTTGDSFQFGIPYQEGYGEVNPEAIVTLSKQIFEVEGKIATDLLFVGNIVPMQDDQGNPMNGKITEIEDDSVTMDFNHPMAGRDLFFEGEVIEIREADAQEIEHGHPHGPGGVEH